MAYLIPPDYPPDTSPGEVLVFEALREPSTGRGWTVLHSLHIPEHIRQVEGEADFVVLMPGLGVLTLEVKGHLRADYVDGAWYLGESAGPDYRGPFRQSEMAARSIKRKVVEALPSASRILFWSAVLFTHCTPTVRAPTGDWHPWQLLTSADLDLKSIERLLEDVMCSARDHVARVEQARWFDPAALRPSKTECERIRRVLRPDLHFLPATSTIRQRRIQQIRRFTEEQLEIIDGLDGVNERAVVEGPAGTGKTVLAFEEARKASSLGARTALLCFNQQLAAHLKNEAEQFKLVDVDILSFHALLRRVAEESPPSNAGHDYWAQVLPDKALARLLDAGPRYDFLIIDEAQDLVRPAYLDVMDALLVNELSSGSWRMFGDFERQAIFDVEPEDTVNAILRRSHDVARYRLRRNCRNTPRVAEYVVQLGGLSPGYTRVMRPDPGREGTPRTSFYASSEDQQRLLKEALGQLQQSGEFAPEDIVVLSPVVDSCALSLSKSKGSRLVALPERQEGASSFGTISAFKGLEAPAVILTDIDEVGTPRAQRLFYVAVSRATDCLRVLIRDGLQRAVARLVTGGMPDARVR